MLEARSLSIAPPGSREPIVSDCSLRLAPGEWVGVTGPNGSGKSCLALALAGLSPIQSGTLRFDGEMVEPPSRPAPAGALAMVLQEPASQLFTASVFEELGFTARNLGRPEIETRAEIEQWSARFGLGSLWSEDPRTLSAGWQQVVLIAAALVTRPRVLIVDEGGAHLDARLRGLVLAALRDPVGRGLSIVWVSQEGEELSAADRVLVLGADRTGKGEADPVPEAKLGTPLLGMRIAPWNGERGPHVRTDVPLEILVPSSGLVALVGPNGCGKSVVLEAAAGLIQCPQVALSWREPARLPPILAGQYPEQQICCEQVAEELRFGALGRGASKDWASEQGRRLLARMGLDDAFLTRRTWNLSTGEKRIVELIAALSTPAKLVLLDEPTCGLDHERKFMLMKLVRERAREDSVVVASQDRAWLREMRAAMVDLGRTGPGFDAKSQQKNGLTQTCPSA